MIHQQVANGFITAYNAWGNRLYLQLNLATRNSPKILTSQQLRCRVEEAYKWISSIVGISAFFFFHFYSFFFSLYDYLLYVDITNSKSIRFLCPQILDAISAVEVQLSTQLFNYLSLSSFVVCRCTPTALHQSLDTMRETCLSESNLGHLSWNWQVCHTAGIDDYVIVIEMWTLEVILSIYLTEN